MIFLWLDFETYYDDEYSLRKMTPAEYILDPRFETIMVSTQVDNGPIVEIDAPDFPAFLAQFDPKNTVTVTFNALFDNCILAWHYGFVPVRMIDVLGMARTLLGHLLPSLSLAHVSEHLGTGRKGNTLFQVKGMRRAQIMTDPPLWENFKRYAGQDVYLMHEDFNILAKTFPKSEYRVMDLVLRCAVCPRFVCDIPMLEKHLEEVKAEKKALLATVYTVIPGTTTIKDDLMSSAHFAERLTALGVEVQYKQNAAGKMIPAFAKTDDFMADLQEHEDSAVQALVAARLGLKSTIEESRTERLLGIARLNWSTYQDGSPRLYSGGNIPIPLRLAGAHTLRLSGDWKMNMQNMPAPRGAGAKSKLRKSIKAPPGHKVIVADLGQIEARLTAWLCKSKVLLQAFQDGKDPYALLGGEIFGIVVDVLVHKLERFIGKSGVLGLGFGAAAAKFYTMVIRSARTLGMTLDMNFWTPELAQKSVDTYRKVNFETPRMWQYLEEVLMGAWTGASAPVTIGPVTVKQGAVVGPNGLEMRYADPEASWRDKSYRYGAQRRKIYGAKFLENIIQFLARIVIFDIAVRLANRGLPFAIQEHDALGFIVPDAEVDNAVKIVHEEFVRRPTWAPDLPLKADVGVGISYGDAK